MKTTIDIADNVLLRSKRLAREEHQSLKELVEEGLVLVMEKHGARTRRPVTPVVVNGKGLTATFRDKSWADIRNAAYEGRGS